MNDISIVKCKDYSENEVKEALSKLLALNNSLDFEQHHCLRKDSA